MTNTSMSVYNKYTDESKNTVYKKHLIENVFWDDAKSVNLTQGYDKADDVNIYIPKDKNDMKNYVKPKQYTGSKSEWTLNEGDFIVRGNININEVSKIKDLSKFDDVFTITLVDDKDFGSSNMQHFEIKGK